MDPVSVRIIRLRNPNNLGFLLRAQLGGAGACSIAERIGSVRALRGIRVGLQMRHRARLTKIDSTSNAIYGKNS
jgi:hypothetical protein